MIKISSRQLGFTLIFVVAAACAFWWVEREMPTSESYKGGLGLDKQPEIRVTPFSSDDLKENLQDFGVLKIDAIIIDDSDYKNRLKKVLFSGGGDEVDAEFQKFIFDKKISRGEKLSMLMLLVKEARKAEEVSYVLDLMSSFQPIEKITELIALSGEVPDVDLKRKILSTVEEALQFQPAGVIDYKTEEYLNAKIQAAHDFFISQSLSEDALIRGRAIAAIAKTIPQDQAVAIINQAINSANLSKEEVFDVKLNLAASAQSHIQYEFMEELLSGNTIAALGPEKVRAKIGGFVLAGDVDQMMTPETRALVSNYLDKSEPISSANGDPVLFGAEYSEWVFATAKINASSNDGWVELVSNRVKGLDDPLKIASIITSSPEGVVVELKRGGALSLIETKLRAAMGNGENKMIAEAIDVIRSAY